MWVARPVRPHRRKRVDPVIRVPPVGVKGRVRWSVFNEDGTPALADVVRADGRATRQHEADGWQSNLIVDSGLDDWCESASLTSDSQAWPVFRNALLLGTSSVAPAVTDTALGNQVESGSTAGTVSGGTLDLVSATLMRVTTTRSVRITMTGDRNLTEFGFARGTTLGPSVPLFIRELFRDGVGTPITISILTGKALQVEHELTIEIPRSGALGTLDINTFDIANTLTGTVSYDMETGLWYAPNTGTPDWRQSIYYAVSPGLILGGQSTNNKPVTAGRYESAATLPESIVASQYGTTMPAGAGSTFTGTITADAYTPGTFARVRRHLFSDTQLQGESYGYIIRWPGGSFGAFGADPGYFAGWSFKFVSPTTFTKLADHQLTVAFETSLARI